MLEHVICWLTRGILDLEMLSTEDPENRQMIFRIAYHMEGTFIL